MGNRRRWKTETSLPLVLALAVGIHLDWHLARTPVDWKSFGWRYHWIYVGVGPFYG